MRKLKLATATLLGALVMSASALTAAAQDAAVLKPLNVAMMEGQYAGTFLCGAGEMGMTLSIRDIGGTINPDGKSADTNKRLIDGVLNFFPTVGNPNAPHGAFEVDGTAEIYNYFTKVKLNPSKWLDKSENFGGSGLEGMISKTGHFSGTPTVSGCHTLNMTKLRTQ